MVRGQSMRIEVALEGVGVSVMGGLQDELFNLTMDKIEVGAGRAVSCSVAGMPELQCWTRPPE